MKALYRKYRPTKLSEVVGQEQVTKNLEMSLKNGKFSHAYLFIGPRGCGKTSVARILAHEINGFKYTLEDFYPDILEIDAASNTGVDNIRELRERALIAPAEGKYKVYIIDEVHMLSKSAFNALLKTLEEPPSHVVFIMATTDAYKVPDTIKSRSQIFEFQLVSPDVMKKHLESIAEKENLKIASDALDIIIRRGGGSFRDSISLLDQISTLTDGEITAELVTSSLGLPEQTKISALLDAYQSQDLAEISARIKALLNSGVRPEIIAEEIIDQIVESPSPSLLPLLKPLTSVSAPFPEAKLLLAFTSDKAQSPKGLLNNKEISPRKITNARGPESETVAKRNFSEGPPERYGFEGREISHSANPSALSPSTFDWQQYFQIVQKKSPSIADVLKHSTSKIENTTLSIIPEKSIYKTILLSKNNAELLKSSLPEGYNLQILDPKNIEIAENDPQISKISDIMGGKVMEVKPENGGNIPF